MSKNTELTNDHIDWLQTRCVAFYDYYLNTHLKKLCESPIEEKMLVGLYVVFLDFVLATGSWASFNKTKSNDAPLITPQAKIGKYRVDFLIRIPEKKPVVVECDGHDFHERTKEQAARDRSRDRTLTEAGYTVVRFTGSEIWKDPMSCAAQVRRLAEVES